MKTTHTPASPAAQPAPAFVIPAEVHSDDHAAEAAFDAAPWFAQASETEIADLAACEWRGDYPADEVAIWTAENTENDEINAVFAYIAIRRKVESIGFECSVDEDAARAWLAANRPALALPPSE
jgi:hypothetical protein